MEEVRIINKIYVPTITDVIFFTTSCVSESRDIKSFFRQGNEVVVVSFISSFNYTTCKLYC